MRRPRWLSASLALALAGGVLAFAPTPVEAQAPPTPEAVAPAPLRVVAGTGTRPVHVPPPPMPRRSGSALVAHSTIDVTYTGFTPQAQAAFQYAADLLETVVFSSVPITVNASYADLGGNTLGSAGPAVAYDSNGFPGLGLVPSRFYPVALINARQGHDQCPTASTPNCLNTAFDINAQFSSTFPFYLGTDGNVPLGQYDFVSIVLHELSHGLGFLAGGYTVTTTSASRDSALPYIYEHFIEAGANAALTSLTGAALKAALTGNNLFFDGPAADAANGGNRPKVYAPATYAPGSTLGHLDEATYPAGNPNALMTPTFNDGESVHDPGPIGRGVFKDIGWSVALYPYRAPGDFDGDGDSDVGVFRPTTGQWFIVGQPTRSFGGTGDVPVSADYDGDRRTDLAVWRPSTGQWFVNAMATLSFGANGDVPVPADYDGDGDVDVAVWRPGTGQWFIAGQGVRFFGAASDVPLPRDYDGDGDADIAVWRPGTGQWFISGLANPFFGGSGDVPVPADYDGDGDADISVWRPSTGQWYIANQSSPFFGGNGDLPIPADYNGDGKADLAVFRPSNGTWYIQGANPFALSFGANGDIPTTKRPTLGGGN